MYFKSKANIICEFKVECERKNRVKPDANVSGLAGGMEDAELGRSRGGWVGILFLLTGSEDT